MYICSNCQKEYKKWQGQCDSCKSWGTLEEVKGEAVRAKGKTFKGRSEISNIKPVKLGFLDKETSGSSREIKTGIYEFDNTLGGRLVRGQVVLLAGSPGIGKSTLLSQVTDRLSRQNLGILYVCGEESPEQIEHRVKRLKLNMDNVLFYPETNIAEIEKYVASNSKKFQVLIVDSIQTLYDPSLTSSSGSISQISESTNRLTNLAKGFGITTFIVGHVTKSGDIAGPKIMEHMVDTVLYFEGERRYEFRILRVEKNRFGPTDETGIFRMEGEGLVEVKDTKELFDPNKTEAPGSVYCMVMEGTRPVVVEVQALAAKTYFTNPRRTTSGFDLNRLYILLAIIEKVLKIGTGEFDVYVNITGGIKVTDTALDLAVINAVISSIKNKTIAKTSIYFGEVGLTGEIRKTFLEEKRAKEAKRLGFKEINYKGNIKQFV